MATKTQPDASEETLSTKSLFKVENGRKNSFAFLFSCCHHFLNEVTTWKKSDAKSLKIRVPVRRTRSRTIFMMKRVTPAVFRQSTKPPMCSSFWQLICRFRQRAANWGSVLVRRFSASRYTYFRLNCYLKPWRKCAGRGWDGRRCQWPALLCDPQPRSFKTKKQLITAVSPSLHPRALSWATGQLLRSRRW